MTSLLLDINFQLSWSFCNEISFWLECLYIFLFTGTYMFLALGSLSLYIKYQRKHAVFNVSFISYKWSLQFELRMKNIGHWIFWWYKHGSFLVLVLCQQLFFYFLSSCTWSAFGNILSFLDTTTIKETKSTGTALAGCIHCSSCRVNHAGVY